MTRDHSGRSKWSREEVANSNAIDGFFQGTNALVILVVRKLYGFVIVSVDVT